MRDDFDLDEFIQDVVQWVDEAYGPLPTDISSWMRMAQSKLIDILPITKNGKEYETDEGVVYRHPPKVSSKLYFIPAESPDDTIAIQILATSYDEHHCKTEDITIWVARLFGLVLPPTRSGKIGFRVVHGKGIIDGDEFVLDRDMRNPFAVEMAFRDADITLKRPAHILIGEMVAGDTRIKPKTIWDVIEWVGRLISDRLYGDVGIFDLDSDSILGPV